jgi:rhodanese-related sulfurtransferase
MVYLILTAIIVTAFILYNRYFPVLNVDYIPLKDLKLDKIKIIDVRDYNEPNHDTINGAIRIPIAYLKRYVNEIPKEDLHLVTASLLERNIGIRFLRKEGYRIAGYTMINHKHLSLQENSLKIETNG